MRPGRILLFLLAVVLTLFILSLLTVSRRAGEVTLPHEQEISAGDSSGVSDTLTEQVRENDSAAEAGDHTDNGRGLAGISGDTAGSTPGNTADGTSGNATGGNPAAGTSGNTSGNASKGTGASTPRAQPSAIYPGDIIRDSLAGGKQVRIIYYGDSQVEGDRVTSFLRKELRKEGGGTGPGMISPVMPVMYTRSWVVRSSSNWRRYTMLDYRNGILPHNRLGPMLALCRFTPPGDTMQSRSFATVKITAVTGADPEVSKYDNLRIFYGNNHDTVLVGIKSGSSLVDFAMLQMGEGPMEYSVPLPSVSEVTIEFTGRNSPDIYAMSLESRTGVIVDNVPVRGSAGLEFVMTDIRGLEETYTFLKPDIVFMQFGLNVVRNVRSEYHYYEDGLVNQVNFLKKASGGAPVVLVSVTDMALRDNDTIMRFPNIKAIRDAQKNAASRSGAIFWDALESMGGTGSVVTWFNHNPPLASKDLTHLSNEGTDTIASRIYSALMSPRAEPVPDITGAAQPVASYLTDTLPGSDETSVRDSVPWYMSDTLTAGVSDTEDMTGEPDLNASDRFSIPRQIISWISSVLRYHPDQTFIFTTPAFWIFFLFVMAGFALLHRRRAMCHTWLLVVSLYFYYRAGGLFIILLLLTTLLTWLTAIMTGKAGSRAGKRFWLITNLFLLLGFLSYFKYAGFFTEVINSVFNTSLVARDIFSAWSNSLFGTSFNVTTIILPVGISFFTFQALSYSIDVYRGRIAAERSFTDFAFYLTFFPQLVAGPIVRASEFIPQMKGEYIITRNEFGYGLFLILQGLVKKMLISDFISTGFIDRVFDSPAIYSGFENLMAVYGYGLQIYCDFSGYTDIAIGVAMFIGFRLPLNFNSPYKAENIGEFWRRWHISLSRWLKDYLYIPLGGNRKGPVRTGINLMVTMLLGGLWHGAAARFVVWGGLHGVALVIEKIWHRIFRNVTRKRRIARVAGILLTFNFVSFAWIFFRAGSMEQAGVMLSQIFASFTPGDYGTVVMSYLSVVILIVSGYILHFLPVTVKESYRGLFIRMPLIAQMAVTLAVVLLLHRVGTDVVQPFIYFRF
jgi:D-alanyl-lipoteichoic acid acyltransferase DltB (MBOAT superfamily)